MFRCNLGTELCSRVGLVIEWKLQLSSREEMGRYMVGVRKETRKCGSLLYTCVLIQ